MRYVLSAALVAGWLTGPAPALAQTGAEGCEPLAKLALPEARVTRAAVVEAGAFVPPAAGATGGGGTAVYKTLPAFCRVEATLTPSSDSDIKVEVWLPVSGWNRRLQAVGNGGWSGSVGYAGLARAVARGYAAASTDTGHQGDRASFALGHPEKLVDFGGRAVHLMTVHAKSIVSAYYGDPAKYAYWNGCSSGGKQGLKEAQRYPADFDGIIAGAPANNWIHQKAAVVAVNTYVHRDPESNIPESKYPMIHDAVLAACDLLDGVKDGVLENPRRCAFDPKVLECKAGDAPTCLTPKQVEAARKILAPVKNPRTGAEIFPGLTLGTELSWGVQAGPEPRTVAYDLWAYFVFKNLGWNYLTLDLDRDVALADKMDAEGPQMAAVDPDLGPFFGRGGKLLMYHGWADPNIVATNSVNYYGSVASALGGVENTKDSMRLFMVPGMAHCNGGDGPNTFDMVTALEQWVEQGRTPARIVASKLVDGKPVRTRPLCPYPQVAVYKGTGSTDDEANFVCKAQ
jgi:feruloyl esterase